MEPEADDSGYAVTSFVVGAVRRGENPSGQKTCETRRFGAPEQGRVCVSKTLKIIFDDELKTRPFVNCLAFNEVQRITSERYRSVTLWCIEECIL